MALIEVDVDVAARGEPRGFPGREDSLQVRSPANSDAEQEMVMEAGWKGVDEACLVRSSG